MAAFNEEAGQFLGISNLLLIRDNVIQDAKGKSSRIGLAVFAYEPLLAFDEPLEDVDLKALNDKLLRYEFLPITGKTRVTQDNSKWQILHYVVGVVHKSG